jgi:hypothetical protein
VWGFQTKVEQFSHQKMVRDIMLLGHKQNFCWIDEWFGLTMDVIRKYEFETQDLLTKVFLFCFCFFSCLFLYEKNDYY